MGHAPQGVRVALRAVRLREEWGACRQEGGSNAGKKWARHAPPLPPPLLISLTLTHPTMPSPQPPPRHHARGLPTPPH